VVSGKEWFPLKWCMVGVFFSTKKDELDCKKGKEHNPRTGPKGTQNQGWREFAW